MLPARHRTTKPYLSRRFAPPAASLLLLAASLPAQEKSPWGLRNLRLLPHPEGEHTWQPVLFDQYFGEHDAGHVAFWLLWGDVQADGACTPLHSCPSMDCDASPPGIEVDVLEACMDLVETVGADPVIVFHAVNSPGTISWAMQSATAEQLTMPRDLDTCTPIEWPTPTGEGYSAALYTVAYDVASHVASEYPGTAYFRFHNEPWSEWALGPESKWDHNLETYLRSYLTFRQAVENAEDDAIAMGASVDFRVGHGSLPRGRMTYRYYLSFLTPGVPVPAEVREWVIKRLNSYTERNRCVIETLYSDEAGGISLPIEPHDWQSALDLMGSRYQQGRKLDAWLDKFVEWTAAGYFDFTTVHPHGKPYFYPLEKFYFDDRVTELQPAAPCGYMGDDWPPRWLAAEAAFELLDQERWGVIPCPGATLEEFTADDLARKWVTLVANDTAFCSPIVGGPHPQYTGLYAPETPMEPVGCPPPCPPPALTGCMNGICPLLPDKAFTFLADEIGDLDDVDDLSSGPNAHYRFEGTTPQRAVDVVWRRTLFDAGAGTQTVVIAPPSGYDGAVVYNVLEETIATFPSSVTLADLGQSPRVVIWTPVP